MSGVEDSWFEDPPPAQSPPTPRSPSPVPPFESPSDHAEQDHTPHLFPEQNSLEIDYGADENESMYRAGYDAANDPPYIHLAYLSAVESSVIHHNSVTGVNAWLSAHIASLRLAGAMPENITPLVTLDSVRS